MKNDNSKNKTSNKKQRITLIIGLVLLLFLAITFVVDLVLFYKNFDLSNIFKIIEIVLSSGAAISFSLSLSITVNNNILKKKNVAKGNGLAINESNSVDLKDVNLFSGDKQNIQVTYIGAGIQEFLTVYNEVLLPHQAANIESIAKKTYEELSKQPSDKEINKDFVIKYIEDSKNISGKDIQDIWVKLLLLETKEGGGVSKRTLDIIKI